MSDLPTQPTSEAPTQRDTDPHELKPSLPPNSFTYADVVATHHSILDEMKGMRIDMLMLSTKIDEVKHLLQTSIDGMVNAITRVEVLEAQAEHGFLVCRYHHSNGGDHLDVPSTDESE